MSIAEMDTGFQSDHGEKDCVCAWYLWVFSLKNDLTIVLMFFPYFHVNKTNQSPFNLLFNIFSLSQNSVLRKHNFAFSY